MVNSSPPSTSRLIAIASTGAGSHSTSSAPGTVPTSPAGTTFAARRQSRSARPSVRFSRAATIPHTLVTRIPSTGPSAITRNGEDSSAKPIPVVRTETAPARTASAARASGHHCGSVTRTTVRGCRSTISSSATGQDRLDLPARTLQEPDQSGDVGPELPVLTEAQTPERFVAQTHDHGHGRDVAVVLPGAGGVALAADLLELLLERRRVDGGRRSESSHRSVGEDALSFAVGEGRVVRLAGGAGVRGEELTDQWVRPQRASGAHLGGERPHVECVGYREDGSESRVRSELREHGLDEEPQGLGSRPDPSYCHRGGSDPVAVRGRIGDEEAAVRQGRQDPVGDRRRE